MGCQGAACPHCCCGELRRAVSSRMAFVPQSPAAMLLPHGPPELTAKRFSAGRRWNKRVRGCTPERDFSATHAWVCRPMPTLRGAKPGEAGAWHALAPGDAEARPEIAGFGGAKAALYQSRDQYADIFEYFLGQVLFASPPRGKRQRCVRRFAEGCP